MKALFSYLCHQSSYRSFWIDENLLPICERCTGIYLGIGLSVAFLLLIRFYKKGFPPNGIILLNVISLLIMPIFGFHLIDPGPNWRLWSGLMFGNGMAFLLLPSTSILVDKMKRLKTYTKSNEIQLWSYVVFLNTIPMWFPIQQLWFYYFVLLIVLLGLLCVLLCVSFLILKCLNKLGGFLILKGVKNETSTHFQSPL